MTEEWMDGQKVARNLLNGERRQRWDRMINGYRMHNGRPTEDGAMSSSLWFDNWYFRNQPKLVLVHQMVSRTLSNITVEPSQRADVFISQEGECEWPHDQPELSDNDTEIDRTTQLSLVEANRATDTDTKMTRANTPTNGENSLTHGSLMELSPS
jgi:hypothetical protein